MSTPLGRKYEGELSAAAPAVRIPNLASAVPSTWRPQQDTGAFLPTWRTRVYALLRTSTQAGILAMALTAAFPVLAQPAIRLGSSADAPQFQIPAVMILACFTLAGFVLTSTLRQRWQDELGAAPER